jgi:hypothetical protein
VIPEGTPSIPELSGEQPWPASTPQRPAPKPHRAWHRRCGIQAATRYVMEFEELRAPYSFVTPQEWPPAGFPLGTWLADQRRFFNSGKLDQKRAQELDRLGMVWSHFDVAFAEGPVRAWRRSGSVR